MIYLQHRKLRRSAIDRSIAGVCGGIAEYLNLPSFWVRLAFVLIPFSLLLYIILANILPISPKMLYPDSTGINNR
ncbi:PspC domain-containing protein [Rummeliibacillus suwonensis]|uniref:PspC domain-containing protein n=1 Tax=Rummeliibacillus suwonensis TaxID=1306154 RepID=UPI00289E805C|nr:PspC domain-containing protein [Rummeliibacillus suwonensis]